MQDFINSFSRVAYSCFLFYVISIYSDIEEYSFSNPADSWPSTYDDVIASGPPTAFRTVNNPGRESSSSSTRGQKRLRPIRTIRKIAGWVKTSSPLSRSARGFGSQNFI